MITMQAVVARVRGVDEHTLTVWVREEWVRPRRDAGQPVFEEVDVARVQLIAELRELEVGDGAMPVVLSLLDQLHEARGHMRRLCAALEGDEGVRAAVAGRLGRDLDPR